MKPEVVDELLDVVDKRITTPNNGDGASCFRDETKKVPLSILYEQNYNE